MRTPRYLYIIVVVIVSILHISTPSALAVPAKRGAITVTEPDGNKINIRLNGDEFFSWRTTEEGYPITEGEGGYYYYGYFSDEGNIVATVQRVSIKGVIQTPPAVSTASKSAVTAIASRKSSEQRSLRRLAASSRSGNQFPSSGTVRSVVILVEYSDVKFSVENPKQSFYNQLNLEGYSVDGAVGSARDYFKINSKGTFDGEFDVYGPYTLAQTRKYYGQNDRDGYDQRPDEMVWDAVALADKDVDFSQYDLDEDGYIDNIFVYYAGHNEAEGASAETVWPHAWSVNARPEYDGKTLYGYACTSELRGSRGTTIAGIGTFCHEFSHILGLADHYDTNDSTNGSAYGLGYYDIMSSGSYNNDGNTPPMHNGLELDMIGWNTPQLIEEGGEITIEPIDIGQVYRINTDVEDEYFLIENRYKFTPNHPWDKFIAADGLFITHVDRSKNYIGRWYANEPNAYSTHECFRFVVAGNEALSEFKNNENMVPYPTTKGNNEWSATSKPAAQSWSGAELDFAISNIVRGEEGRITFTVNQLRQTATGEITDDATGHAIADATVTYHPLNLPPTAISQTYQATTNKEGVYSIELREGDYQIEVEAKNYQSTTKTVAIKQGKNIINIALESYANGVESYEVTPYQTSAVIKWNPKSYSTFLLKLTYKGCISPEIYSSNECQTEIMWLKSATPYTVTISGKSDSGDYDDLYTVNFTTLNKTISIPIICLDKYRYSAGESIELRMLNCDDDDQVSWMINDKPLLLNKITLEAGEHTVVGKVKRNEKSYMVHRKIIVE